MKKGYQGRTKAFLESGETKKELSFIALVGEAIILYSTIYVNINNFLGNPNPIMMEYWLNERK